jgi:hypothetical protein
MEEAGRCARCELGATGLKRSVCVPHFFYPFVEAHKVSRKGELGLGRAFKVSDSLLHIHMIIWRGRGILIAIIIFGCLLATELLTRSFLHDNTYYQQHGWPKFAGFLIAAGLVWWLARREAEDSTGVHNATRESFFRERDTLFLISARYWPRILCVLGIVFYFVRVRD